MRTIKREEGFGYPIPEICRMCLKYKATVCVQIHAPIATHQINWNSGRKCIYYCTGCNMIGDGK